MRKNILAILCITFIGYHGGKTLHEVFSLNIIDTIAIVALVELLVFNIGKIGLSNYLVWPLKFALLIASVFFSLFGQYNDYSNTQKEILEAKQIPLTILHTAEIANAQLKIETYQSKNESLKIQREKLLAIGDQKAGEWKEKDYTGNEAAYWRLNSINRNKREIIKIKTQINTWNQKDQLAETQNANILIQRDKSKQLNNLKLQKELIKCSVFAFLIGLFGFINMILTYEKAQATIEEEAELKKKYSRKKLFLVKKKQQQRIKNKYFNKEDSIGNSIIEYLGKLRASPKKKRA